MAVDLLVMHPDAIDTSGGQPGGWQAGYIVDAFEAPDPRFPIGPALEQHPRFIVVRILDPVTKADVLDLLEVLYDLTQPSPPDEFGEVTYPLKRKRVGYFDYTELNNPQMKAIRETREAVITEGMFNTFVKRNT
jgi:hypothetical protein